jgi:hypothetical protein
VASPARLAPSDRGAQHRRERLQEVEAGGEAGGSLTMLEAVHRRMGEAVAAGMGARDWSAIADFTLGATPRPR